MTMERQGEKLRFHCTRLLKGRCLQVRAASFSRFSTRLTQSYPNTLFTVEPESMDIGTSPTDPDTDDLYMGLTVNSMVEVTLCSGNSYGIIRWIGNLPGRPEIMAGLELVTFIFIIFPVLRAD